MAVQNTPPCSKATIDHLNLYKLVMRSTLHATCHLQAYWCWEAACYQKDS